MDINTKIIEIGDKMLKKAPQELLTLVAQLREEPKTKELDQEPTNIVDNALAKEVLAKCKDL